jgi:hypothetical protein
MNEVFREMWCAIIKFQPFKSPGMDGIKILQDVLVPRLSKTYNQRLFGRETRF